MLIKNNQKITTCNQLDLETLGFFPDYTKNLLGYIVDLLMQHEHLTLYTLATIVCHPLNQYPGRFFGIIGQNPSVSKSDQLHVVIFRLFFMNLRHIL